MYGRGMLESPQTSGKYRSTTYRTTRVGMYIDEVFIDIYLMVIGSKTKHCMKKMCVT
jgi:hypothetical protein